MKKAGSAAGHCHNSLHRARKAADPHHLVRRLPPAHRVGTLPERRVVAASRGNCWGDTHDYYNYYN